jgi:hypothetical protein
MFKKLESWKLKMICELHAVCEAQFERSSILRTRKSRIVDLDTVNFEKEAGICHRPLRRHNQPRAVTTFK